MISTLARPGVSEAPATTTRPARPGDEAGMLDVLVTAFDGWPRFEVQVAPLDHLRWQLQGYLPQEKAHFVTEVEGRIAALDIGYIRRFNLRGLEVSGWVGTDGATHTDFQGRGVYSKVRRYRQDEIATAHDLMLSQTTNPVISRYYTLEDGRVAWGNRPALLLKVLDAGRLACQPGSGSLGIRRNVLARRTAFGLIGVLGKLRASIHRAPSPHWALRRVDHFDQRFDAFWQQAVLAFDFIGARDSEFLNWRYADPRAGEHVVLAAEAEDEVLGYIALKTNGERGAIMDLLALPGREDVTDSLIAAAIAHFRSEGCSAVQFITVARHPYNRVLRRYGFFDLRRREDFYCGAMRLDGQALRFLEDKQAAVHLTDGDMV